MLPQTESLHLLNTTHNYLQYNFINFSDDYKYNTISHPPGAELVTAPNTGVEFACCPKTEAALGLAPAPKAGGWEGVALKGDPKDEPNEGV